MVFRIGIESIKATYRQLIVIGLLACINGACQKKIDLRELIVDIDSHTGATPAYDPDRVIPSHLSKNNNYRPFMIDINVMNLALYKPVTSNEEPVTGELEQITDDIKTSGEFDFVGGPAWVQVDLEESSSIHAIVIWHHYENADIFDDVIVCVSDDEDFSGDVRTLYNNDHDNSSGMGMGQDSAYISSLWGNIVDARGLNFTGTNARFVRVHTKRNADGTIPRYIELAVYGHSLLDKYKSGSSSL